MNGVELFAIMPVYNEDANIFTVVTQWLDAFAHEGIICRLLVINDGSTDTTLAILKQLQLQFPEQLLILDKANSGHGKTCRAGYEAAVQQEVLWIFQIDSDGQCDPAFFPLFWAKRKEADCIYGFRVWRDDGILRKLIAIACRLLTSIATGRDVKDVNVPYRLIKRPALSKALESVPREFELQNVALTLALKRNRALRWVYIPIRFRARQGGTNKMNLRKIAKLGVGMLIHLHTIRRST